LVCFLTVQRIMNYLNKIILFILLLGFIACDDERLESLSDIVYIRNDKADMPAYIYGNGSSNVFIIVLHGGPGGNGLDYRLGTYTDLLEQQYAMVYWDQRGQGMTQSNGDKSLINIDQLADDVEKLVLVLKDRYDKDAKFILMGHSWGGTLGTYFLLDGARQSLVDAWIEVDGAHDIPKLSKEALAMMNDIGLAQITAGNSTTAWQNLVDWANAIVPDSIQYFTSEINQKSWDAINLLADDDIIEMPGFVSLSDLRPVSLITGFLSGLRTVNLLFEEIERLSLTDDLYKIDLPCLFLWGRYDIVVPPQLAQDAYEKVSSDIKFLHYFEKSGHSPMSTEPELFVQKIQEFVKIIP